MPRLEGPCPRECRHLPDDYLTFFAGAVARFHATMLREITQSAGYADREVACGRVGGLVPRERTRQDHGAREPVARAGEDQRACWQVMHGVVLPAGR